MAAVDGGIEGEEEGDLRVRVGWFLMDYDLSLSPPPLGDLSEILVFTSPSLPLL